MASFKVARLLRKNNSWAERLMWKWLRDRRFSGYKFRRQHPFGPHILDFFCIEATLNIELDGFQHGSPEHRARDAKRDAWLEHTGVKVLRFWCTHPRRDKELIRNAIWQALQERAPKPVPKYCRSASDTDPPEKTH
ncbi:MAG: endonuclease domain-containing protein [Verrucomicrobia bacterium]|nr:endonuclease domain-containing protein [Verrucomicrobiota bacterium]